MNNNLPALDLNVLPDGYRRRRLSAKQALLSLVMVAAIILAFLVYQAACDTMDKTADLRDELAPLTQEAELRKLETDRQYGMTKTINEYQTISERRGILTEDLKAIQSTAEEAGIEITSLSHGEESVTIFCHASGHSTFNEYRQAFEHYCEALVQTGRFYSAWYPPLNFPPIASVNIVIER